jgi:hypothetical protein
MMTLRSSSFKAANPVSKGGSGAAGGAVGDAKTVGLHSIRIGLLSDELESL